MAILFFQLNHATQKLQRLTLQLQDIRTAGMGVTPEGMKNSYFFSLLDVNR